MNTTLISADEPTVFCSPVFFEVTNISNHTTLVCRVEDVSYTYTNGDNYRVVFKPLSDEHLNNGIPIGKEDYDKIRDLLLSLKNFTKY